jgi:hypothetical protein
LLGIAAVRFHLVLAGALGVASSGCISSTVVASDWFRESCVETEGCAPAVAGAAVGEVLAYAIAAGVTAAVAKAEAAEPAEDDGETEPAIAPEPAAARPRAPRKIDPAW